MPLLSTFWKGKKCSFSWKLREFSRKFALKLWEEPRRLGLRFFFSLNAKVFKRFQVARGSYDVLLPRELRWRFLKVACIFSKIFASLIFFFIFLRVHLIRACITLTGSQAPPKFKEFSNFWRLKCSRSIHVALILNFENCMFRVIRRRPRVRSRGGRSN